MKNISMFETQEQIRKGLKIETTRKIETWEKLKVGDILMTVEKCQGIPKGEKQVKIRPIRIVKKEEIFVNEDYYNLQNCINEGFPELSTYQFITEVLLKKCGLDWEDPVRRITFEYVVCWMDCENFHKCHPPIDGSEKLCQLGRGELCY